MRSLRLVLLLLCTPVLVWSCGIDPVAVTLPEDVVVAEVFLRSGSGRQLAFLHRTLGSGRGDTVPNAVVQVIAPDGRVLRFSRVSPIDCLTDRAAGQPVPIGTCYAGGGGGIAMPPGQLPPTIDPGSTYELRITLLDGKVMTGTTRVPGTFAFRRPATTNCSLPPDTRLDLGWTPSQNAWVYVAETTMSGIQTALAARNIFVPDDNLRLLGLAISRADTAIVFPTEFGVFERGDDETGPVLAAIQNGLPAGVTARIQLAAADRNYVNWMRGGNFNPSGPVRVPSIRGEGTGAFGSLVSRTITIRTGNPTSQFPPC
jgi:hypothetical protein